MSLQIISMLICTVFFVSVWIAFSIKESRERKKRIDSAYVRLIRIIYDLYYLESYEAMLDCYSTLLSSLPFKRQVRLMEKFPKSVKGRTSIEERAIDLNATPYYDISKIGEKDESAD